MSEDIHQLRITVGGSVFELIEFFVDRHVRGQVIRGTYGVNVAKVREVVRMPKINPLVSRIDGVAGLFDLRGVPIPAVHLAVALGDEPTPLSSNQQIIVTEFSQKRAGFIVDGTKRIRRIAWDKVMPPSADAGTFINGMTILENGEFLFILDLDRILSSLEGLSPELSHPKHEEGYFSEKKEVAHIGRVLLVDDSSFIRSSIKTALSRENFAVVEANDGKEALQILEQSLTNKEQNKFDAVITDVEMPRMDGMTLTKKIREHTILKDVPIILHTSLSGSSNQAAGMSLGATAYVIKNDLRSLFEVLRKILEKNPYAASA